MTEVKISLKFRALIYNLAISQKTPSKAPPLKVLSSLRCSASTSLDRSPDCDRSKARVVEEEAAADPRFPLRAALVSCIYRVTMSVEPTNIYFIGRPCRYQPYIVALVYMVTNLLIISLTTLC